MSDERIAAGLSREQSRSGLYDMKQLQHSVEVLDKSDSSSAANSPSVDVKKKEKIRSLWGKVGKQSGLALNSAASSSSSSPKPSAKKWDQALRNSSSGSHIRQTKSAMKFDLAAVAAAAYYQQQEQPQPQMQQSINYMNAPNQSTTQCDCGEDTCQFCNLLLNMEMTDPTMLM